MANNIKTRKKRALSSFHTGESNRDSVYSAKSPILDQGARLIHPERLGRHFVQVHGLEEAEHTRKVKPSTIDIKSSAMNGQGGNGDPFIKEYNLKHAPLSDGAWHRYLTEPTPPKRHRSSKLD